MGITPGNYGFGAGPSFHVDLRRLSCKRGVLAEVGPECPVADGQADVVAVSGGLEPVESFVGQRIGPVSLPFRSCCFFAANVERAAYKMSDDREQRRSNARNYSVDLAGAGNAFVVHVGVEPLFEDKD